MKRAIVATIAIVGLLVAGCSPSGSTASDDYQALEQELAAAGQRLADAELELTQAEAQLGEVTAERDNLVAQAQAAADRYDKSVATSGRIAEIIDDPDAIGSKEEVLDELMTMADPDAVMDDTAFGPVPLRSAWSNTIWGSDATLKTWVTWECDDGSQTGSLWTWAGESKSGEPFELIGVNIDEFDDEGRVTYSLVDWPYDGSYVRDSFLSGNTASN